MFFIRADANSEIATGHVMRCLTIADELKLRGKEVCFITADHFPDEIIRKRGYTSICLNSRWDNLEEELFNDETFINMLKNDNVEGIIVDSYYVSSEYLAALSNVCKTVYIDDIFSLEQYPVDYLINYNIYGKKLDYKSKCLPNTKLLLGPNYAPLRKEFQNIKPILRKEVKSVFISTGGADKYNIAGKILSEVVKNNNQEYRDMEFHVISGVMNKNLIYLLNLQSNNKGIYIHQNVSNMSEIMQLCDIAVSACGSTMYELCACGLPIITYSFADNQLPGVKGFEEEGVVLNCGDVRDGIDDVVGKILENVVKLRNDSNFREKLSFKSLNVIDGRGVKRIVRKDIIMNKKLVYNREISLQLLPKFPHNMLVELTNVCNHECIFCAHKKMNRKLGVCDKELMTKIIKEAYECGTREIGFYLTGEPFACNDLNYYISLSKNLGFEYIYITTNGALVTIDKLKDAVEAGLSSIKFSINAGTKETYKKIHGRDDFDKVINNIKQIYKWRNENYKDFPLFVSFVVVSLNKGEINCFKENIGKYFDDIDIVEAYNQGGNMPELNDGLSIRKGNNMNIPCEMLFNRLHITYEGYLNACCVDFENMMAVEDLSKVSLKDAWHGERMVELRRQHLSGKLEKNMCYNCAYNVDCKDIKPLNKELI